jgi:hypothetical protein
MTGHPGAWIAPFTQRNENRPLNPTDEKMIVEWLRTHGLTDKFATMARERPDQFKEMLDAVLAQAKNDDAVKAPHLPDERGILDLDDEESSATAEFLKKLRDLDA